MRWKNVLDSSTKLEQKRKINYRFGCGGDLHHAKRPEWEKLPTRKSTLAIITTDNPRTENPIEIIKKIEAGI